MDIRSTNRRTFVRAAALTTAGLVGASWLDHPSVGTSYAQGSGAPSPDQALQMLVDGNARFVSGSTTGANRSVARRSEVSSAQYPYAAILSCADSRVPPELGVDAGLGDLFTNRVAGPVLNS